MFEDKAMLAHDQRWLATRLHASAPFSTIAPSSSSRGEVVTILGRHKTVAKHTALLVQPQAQQLVAVGHRRRRSRHHALQHLQ